MKPLSVAISSFLLLSAVLPATAEAQAYCREYNKGVVIGGRVQPGYGTACMQPDGAWALYPADGGAQPAPVYEVAYPPAPVYAAPQPYYPSNGIDAVLPGLALALNVAFDNDDHDGHWRGDRGRWHGDHDRHEWKRWKHRGHHGHD